MSAPYRLFGSELSPYSIKVRAYLRFKGIEHEWRVRSGPDEQEFQRFAKLPLVPVLVGADDFALQDSTPIIEKLEAANPEPSILPEDTALRFLAALIEDYADEWVNKIMFHYRWTYEADQIAAADRIARELTSKLDIEDPSPFAEQIRIRMPGRLGMVGSSPETAPVIEASFVRLLKLLEAHLASRPYLFGGRPALGDFGLSAQLIQALSDPTPGAMARERAPGVVAYCARMADPKVEGPFEPLEALLPTLKPLIEGEIAALYLPWLLANAEASRQGEDAVVRLELPGGAYSQSPQRYATKAFMELRRKRAACAEDAALAALLGESGCDGILAPPTTPAAAAPEPEAEAIPPVAEPEQEPAPEPRD